MVVFKDGFAEASGEITTYMFDLTSGELLGEAQVYVNEGCGLAPDQTLDVPPVAEVGHAVVRSEEKWLLLEDHRGTLYSTIDGSPVEHRAFGPLPVDLTSQSRPNKNHTWCDGEWQVDVVAEAADEHKKSMAEACRYLAETDWYVTRQVETGKAIPDDVIAGRKAARVKANG